jgi:molybdopterin converting factor small subunit
MIKVVVPPPYRGPTRGEAEIAVDGDTVRECLEEVEARCPGFAELIWAPEGKLHRFVRLFVNGQSVDPGALDTPVKPGDEIALLAAIAGG